MDQILLRRREFVASLGAFTACSAFGAEDVAVPLVRFGAFSDSHYADLDAAGTGNVETSTYYRDSLWKVEEFVAKMNSRQVDFIVELGDLKDNSGGADATLSSLDKIEAKLRGFSGPRYHVLGNHDTDCLTLAQFLGRIENTGFGSPMPYYSFARNGVTFIVLDANYTSGGERYSCNNPWDDSNIPQDQLDWLKGELDKAPRRVVVFCHQCLNSNAASSPGEHKVRNAVAVRKILEDSKKVCAVFNGHEHVEKSCDENGIFYYSLKGMTVGPHETHNAFVEVAVYANGTVSIMDYERT